jgi:ethanolamine utilization protein EutA
MSTTVTLVGLDFGTTTMSAVVAAAELVQGAAGRADLAHVRERFRSDLVFTPIDGDDRLDLKQAAALIDDWLAAGDVRTAEVFGGGALLTGLTAQRENAADLIGLIRSRLANVLIASADDPCLESWLAFMGSCGGLSQTHLQTPILNLDIGGGTTNLALGRGGQVVSTGCWFVGARHVQVEPGTYRMRKLSHHAAALLEHLGIRKGVGESLNEMEIKRVLDFYLRVLEGAAFDEVPRDPVARLHEQVAWPRPTLLGDLAITFSGGVGELIYRLLDGEPEPSMTYYGDLGIDLALRIVASPLCNPRLVRLRPAATGRATAFGLLRHTTEVSGSTLFLPRPELLPLADLPILGQLNGAASEVEIESTLALVRRSPTGGCLQVAGSTDSTIDVRTLGTRLADVLRSTAFPAERPLVLLIRENVGKALGSYVTAWGALPLNLIVIDEVAPRDAQYLSIGRPRGPVVPVSFYGLNPPERAT